MPTETDHVQWARLFKINSMKWLKLSGSQGNMTAYKIPESHFTRSFFSEHAITPNSLFNLSKKICYEVRFPGLKST